ncbi:hypothetical protein P4H94_07405 [Paenibacillus macerans]|uniref:Uncharacterized protein n=1 Tax=Paenibacillus macerans TaxID=44252 RepID=A0A6N8EPB3_PAEMA|nr:hypothetical protein [Paenibacillus macerans]MEC0136711.1 hypothetical protein [Paenibacillus macerans]MED4955986.1 hypothetical protein [Paenibacillus macerans]MUG21799.1 hypothetical protein [Paenibacillus macerans]
MHNEFELKVLSLIGTLKNEIDTLKLEVAQLKRQSEDFSTHTLISASDSERMSINSVRDYIKNELINRYGNLIFTNGNRSVGKLTISKEETKIERIMIRVSKSFREKEGYPSGWIMVHEDQLDQYELYFFVVRDFEDNLHTLIMEQDDINVWIRQKSPDSNGNYHFYLNLINGKWIDDREGEYDCTRSYNNWSLIKKLLNLN